MDKDVSQLGAGFEVVLDELQACTVEAVSEAVPELRACVRQTVSFKSVRMRRRRTTTGTGRGGGAGAGAASAEITSKTTSAKSLILVRVSRDLLERQS